MYCLSCCYRSLPIYEVVDALVSRKCNCVSAIQLSGQVRNAIYLIVRNELPELRIQIGQKFLSMLSLLTAYEQKQKMFKVYLVKASDQSNLLFSLFRFQTNSYIIRMNREDNLCWFHGNLSRERAEEILREGNLKEKK